jgi:hypothetical protein
MKVKAIYLSIIAMAFVLNTLAATAHGKTGVHEAPAIAGWYFRAVSGYPAAISFEPVVLFKNGEYYEVGDEPLELLNVAESKGKRPKAWGKWRKTGKTFYLTNSQNKTYDYELGSGNWFPAYAYTGAVKLKPAYEKTSGGNYGNGVNALSITKINFIDATHFSQGSNGGITTANAAAWKKTADAGTYKMYGNTIVLTFNSGKTVKKSFALGATGSPARATNTIIFIGGDAYTDTE